VSKVLIAAGFLMLANMAAPLMAQERSELPLQLEAMLEDFYQRPRGNATATDWECD
jgi:hypothetical protein